MVKKLVSEHWKTALALIMLVACAYAFAWSLGRAVVFAHTSIKPTTAVSPIILREGQSAMLLEDVAGLVRIPYQGNRLYEGPATLQKGSFVQKPVNESN